MKYRTLTVSLFVSVLMTAALAPEASAQDKQDTEVTNPDVILQVNGLVCDVCSLNMEKHLKRIDAVDNVQVKLDEQKVLLTLHDDQTVTEDALREAVANAGFNTEEVDVHEERQRLEGRPSRRELASVQGQTPSATNQDHLIYYAIFHDTSEATGRR